MDKRIKPCTSMQAALKAMWLIPMLIVVASCSRTDHTQSAADLGSSSSQPPASQLSATTLSGVTIQTSPALTPSFDPSILDYVVDCTTSPAVQFAAHVPLGGSLRLFDVGPGLSMLPPHPTGDFQLLFTLGPGERFRFAFAQMTPEYSVRCLPADFPPLSADTNGGSQAEWYLFAPSIFIPPSAAHSPYVIITDSNGTPVWWKKDLFGASLDAKIFGANEIGWSVSPISGNQRRFVIRGFDGRVTSVFSGNLDPHDFQVTPTGTYLAIRYVTRACPPDCADMSPWGGSAQSAVVDNEIVELDKDSRVLWTWKTRDHIALSEAGDSGWFPGVGNDFIHMNAVEPDGTDGVIFSARNLNAIYHFTKSSGAVDWKIGGTNRPESLTVIGDLRPSAMGATGKVLSGQHDVRKWPDGTVSVNDNGTNVRPPSIVRYQIDTLARTAEVVEELSDSRVAAAFCCGSARRLPGGHWLVAWGAAPFLSELDSAGSPVLTIKYNLGRVFSYRAVPILAGTVAATTLRNGMDAMAFARPVRK